MAMLMSNEPVAVAHTVISAITSSCPYKLSMPMLFLNEPMRLNEPMTDVCRMSSGCT